MPLERQNRGCFCDKRIGAQINGITRPLTRGLFEELPPVCEPGAAERSAGRAEPLPELSQLRAGCDSHRAELPAPETVPRQPRRPV